MKHSRESGNLDKKLEPRNRHLKKSLPRLKKLGPTSRQSAKSNHPNNKNPLSLSIQSNPSAILTIIHLVLHHLDIPESGNFQETKVRLSAYGEQSVTYHTLDVVVESDESDSDRDPDISTDESSSGSESPSPKKRAQATEDLPLQYKDLSFISLPDGPIPSDEAQIYAALDLPEIRNIVDFQQKQQPPAQPIPIQTPQVRGMMHQPSLPHHPPPFAPFALLHMQGRPFSPYGGLS
ncbi:hypothetical protein BJ742DRAFT_251128 [Cladochytrium replicatum]|nr:hypothetical protein BJ742DRAFT_251128 [Cladochytrium replicatum]